MEFHEKCQNCGQARSEGAIFCSNCGRPFEDKPEPIEPASEQPQPEPPLMPPSPAQSSTPPPEQKYVAWEDRDNLGFFEALWRTWKESVFSPDQFFSKIPFRGGIAGPLLYALIMGWIGIAISQLWGLFTSGATMEMLEPLYRHYGIDMPPGGMIFGWQASSFFFNVILAPILIVVGLFIVAGIYHLIMMIFSWAERDFEATFRAVAYSEGTMLFMILPFCGSIVAWIWGIVLIIFGFKHMQRMSGGKAALVYFLPLILCCCLAIVVAIVFGAAVIGFLQEMMNSGMDYY